MNLEDEKIQKEADQIHADRLFNQKVRQAANDRWTVHMTVNERLEIWSLLEQQAQDAKVELEKAEFAQKDYLTHRDLKRFQDALKK